MKRNIIVERSVHSARAQAVRYGKQHKLPEERCPQIVFSSRLAVDLTDKKRQQEEPGSHRQRMQNGKDVRTVEPSQEGNERQHEGLPVMRIKRETRPQLMEGHMPALPVAEVPGQDGKIAEIR